MMLRSKRPPRSSKLRSKLKLLRKLLPRPKPRKRLKLLRERDKKKHRLSNKLLLLPSKKLRERSKPNTRLPSIASAKSSTSSV